jgi:hypothetical protein
MINSAQASGEGPIRESECVERVPPHPDVIVEAIRPLPSGER